MSKKKDKRKNLQTRLTAIVEIYIEQKGKENRKKLKDFIELKMDEIISFSESLSRRSKDKNKVPVNYIDSKGNSKVEQTPEALRNGISSLDGN